MNTDIEYTQKLINCIDRDEYKVDKKLLRKTQQKGELTPEDWVFNLLSTWNEKFKKDEDKEEKKKNKVNLTQQNRKFNGKCNNCGIWGHKEKDCRKPGGGAYRGNNNNNGNDSDKNKKPCSHCGSPKHTYNTCWKKFPWLKEHVCENCGRKGHRKQHCTRRPRENNNDSAEQNNNAAEVMMNMVEIDAERNQNVNNGWNRLRNMFGEVICIECDNNDNDSSSDEDNDTSSEYIPSDEET